MKVEPLLARVPPTQRRRVWGIDAVSQRPTGAPACAPSAATPRTEAASGTGKTTALVKRIVRLLASGAAGSITDVVAVTFTEKAAGELKLRLRDEIERVRAAADVTPEETGKLEDAVRRFEEAHISTIRGFCAGLERRGPADRSDRRGARRGFSSHSHFTAVFRRRFGVTPSAAARQLHARTPLPLTPPAGAVHARRVSDSRSAAGFGE